MDIGASKIKKKKVNKHKRSLSTLPTNKSDHPQLIKENSYYNFVYMESTSGSQPLFVPMELVHGKVGKFSDKRNRKLREAEASKAYLGY